MGTINTGILVPVSGTDDTVVGGTWKSISYLRSQSAARRTKFSVKQLEQQAKFSLIM